MKYIAHRNRATGKEQTLKEHSENTASLSKSFAIEELKDVTAGSGMYHDIGKYQPSAQQRIRGSDVRVEHSICGAKAVLEENGKNPATLMMALNIAGHHTGIPDCGTIMDLPDDSTLHGRLKRTCEPYEAYKAELSSPVIDPAPLNKLFMTNCRTREEIVESFAFLTRYCFSCLTDADTIDTIAASGNPQPDSLKADFIKCHRIVSEKLNSFTPETELQKARSRLQKQTFTNIERDAEIYLMNMPTGSGKTLASMKCALRRAIKTGKKRIIYVIPYNSIIDQTATISEKLFKGSAAILRHQSTFSYEDAEDYEEDYRRSAIAACENWDAPIIITTAVQFFESVYSNKRGKLRKLHNIADSVLIFDEAHTMPIEYLQPCLRAIAYSTRYLHSETIFLTATMPDFQTLVRQYALSDAHIIDLVPDHTDFKYFKKNRYSILGQISDKNLLKEAKKYASSLIVVNNRATAVKLYNAVTGRKYHLSTYMTPYDRMLVIEKIREELNQLRKDYPGLEGVPPGRRIVVISTSLIEAGIDLDFAAVFRELNGLENALQAGGRCDREGLLGGGHVYIFERLGPTKTISVQQSILKGIIQEFNDFTSDEAICEYYNRLFYAKKDDITKNSLSIQCKSIDSIPFRTYSEQIKLIDSGSISVAVPRDEFSQNLIRNAWTTGYINTRKIQKYCCSVHENELDELIRQHAVEDIGGVYILSNPDYYDEERGVLFEGKDIIF